MLKKVFLDLDQTLQKDIPIFQFVADCALRISLGYSKNRLKLNVGRCYKKILNPLISLPVLIISVGSNFGDTNAFECQKCFLRG